LHFAETHLAMNWVKHKSDLLKCCHTFKYSCIKVGAQGGEFNPESAIEFYCNAKPIQNTEYH